MVIELKILAKSKSSQFASDGCYSLILSQFKIVRAAQG